MQALGFFRLGRPSSVDRLTRLASLAGRMQCELHHGRLRTRTVTNIVAADAGYRRIRVENPMTDIDGDEMTRIIWYGTAKVELTNAAAP